MRPRLGITARSAASESARASQTASKAGECPPESTSTGKAAPASRCSGISASHEGLSRLSSSTPRRSSSGSSSGVSNAEPAPPRNSRRKSSDGIDEAWLEEALPVGDHLVDLRHALRDPQTAGLGDGKRADRLRPLRRGQQGDHRAV